MVTGYGGTYRAVVVDDNDPMQQNRLGVVVPDIWGDAPVWAVASLTSSAGQLPRVGDEVWVSFEGGDSDYPVWEAGSGNPPEHVAGRGYAGKYRGSVIDNLDPMDQRRLQVIVPEVDSSSAWATPSDEVQYTDLPDPGTEVWIEYEQGDPAYPRWVGLA